jgi:transcriptional regulator with XRE-family HTH domain
MAEKDFAANVAARIKALREARGLSIRALAQRAELPPELVSRSERGLTVVTLPSLTKLCSALGTALPQFFDFDAALPATIIVNADIQRALDLLSGLDASSVKLAVRGLELLLSAGATRSGTSGSERPALGAIVPRASVPRRKREPASKRRPRPSG